LGIFPLFFLIRFFIRAFLFESTNSPLPLSWEERGEGGGRLF